MLSPFFQGSVNHESLPLRRMFYFLIVKLTSFLFLFGFWLCFGFQPNTFSSLWMFHEKEVTYLFSKITADRRYTMLSCKRIFPRSFLYLFMTYLHRKNK